MQQKTPVTKSMRITILGLNYPPETTGIAPYTAGLAEGLHQKGHRVTVLTGVPHYPQWKVAVGYRGRDSTEEINGVRVKRLRHYVPRTPSYLRRILMEFNFGFRLVTTKWDRPDVVVCVSPALFSSLWALLRTRLLRRRPRIVLWTQDLYSLGVAETGTAHRALARVMEQCEGLAARSADGVVAIHETFKSYISNTLDVSTPYVEVIRNWTHLPPALEIDRAKVRADLGWDADDVIVLHAGNMGVKQGLENVINAAALAAKNASRVRFILLGDGSQRARLKLLAKNVANLQFVDPLPGEAFQAALASADILLLNEANGVEGMSVPSKLTSYFAAGNPVLAATGSNSASALEIATAGAGLRVDAGMPASLLAAAELIAADPAMAERMGTAGENYRREHLSAAAAITHFEEYLEGLVKLRQRPVTEPLNV